MTGFKSDKQRKAFFAKQGNVRSDVNPKIIPTDIIPKRFPSGKPIPQGLRRKLFNEFKRVEKANK